MSIVHGTGGAAAAPSPSDVTTYGWPVWTSSSACVRVHQRHVREGQQRGCGVRTAEQGVGRVLLGRSIGVDNNGTRDAPAGRGLSLALLYRLFGVPDFRSEAGFPCRLRSRCPNGSSGCVLSHFRSEAGFACRLRPRCPNGSSGCVLSHFRSEAGFSCRSRLSRCPNGPSGALYLSMGRLSSLSFSVCSSKGSLCGFNDSHVSLAHLSRLL